jgi:hypothetical protein
MNPQIEQVVAGHRKAAHGVVEGQGEADQGAAVYRRIMRFLAGGPGRGPQPPDIAVVDDRPQVIEDERVVNAVGVDARPEDHEQSPEEIKEPLVAIHSPVPLPR